MGRLCYVSVITGLAVLLVLSPMYAGDFKLEPGFTLLFSGKNLDGWRQKKDKAPLDGKTEANGGRFKVDNGVLVLDSKGKGDQYIETAKEFAKDVHIKFDFNPGPKCNNDVFLRGTKFDIVPGNKENKNVKEGEWHTLEILVTGTKVEHKINGATARKSEAKANSSTFVLRSEFGSITIKNIRVKE